MEEPVRVVPPSQTPSDPVALIAAAVEAHALTDEEQARRARERYRKRGIPSLEADEAVAPHLAAGERLLGRRDQATVARVDDAIHDAIHDAGPVYVTTSRLLHLGRETTSLSLAEISELAMADDRILVTMTGGRGLMLDVDEPRQFRVLLAAARSALSR